MARRARALNCSETRRRAARIESGESPEMPTLVRYSPLYARFNGYCLGAFLAAGQQPFAKPRFRAIRQRIQQFFEEIGVDIRLPVRQDAYVKAYADLGRRIRAQLAERDATLHQAFELGEAVTLYAVGIARTTPALRRSFKAQLVPALKRFGLGSLAFDQYQRGLWAAVRRRDGNAQLAQVYLLLSDLLQPLGPEEGACFVAMAFAQPYADYFAQLYRPALEKAGFTAIRAWGGLAEEEYYPFVAPLIARCAAVLADLSAHNLNVANEVGLAHGANRPTFLVMRADAGAPPSNLADLAVLRYDPAAPDWPERQVRLLARFAARHWQAYRASITHEGLIHAAAHGLVQLLRAAGEPVPEALLGLAQIQR